MVFCPKCGTENKDDSKFCVKCGAPLPQSKKVEAQQVSGKSPIIAAILNFIWIGLGYLYLGIKEVRGIPAFGYVIIGLVLVIIGFFISPIRIIGFIISVILAIDAYQKAKGEKGFL
ncbi:zinc-ribbon domain-containing protein [Archaeoglobus sp.]